MSDTQNYPQHGEFPRHEFRSKQTMGNVDNDMQQIAASFESGAQFPPDTDANVPPGTSDPDADDVLTAEATVKLKMETGLWQLILNTIYSKQK